MGDGPWLGLGPAAALARGAREHSMGLQDAGEAPHQVLLALPEVRLHLRRCSISPKMLT